MYSLVVQSRAVDLVRDGEVDVAVDAFMVGWLKGLCGGQRR